MARKLSAKERLRRKRELADATYDELVRLRSYDDRRPNPRYPTFDRDRDYSDDEREFLVAIDRAKRGRVELTWPEVLRIFCGLGWRKG